MKQKLHDEEFIQLMNEYNASDQNNDTFKGWFSKSQNALRNSNAGNF